MHYKIFRPGSKYFCMTALSATDSKFHNLAGWYPGTAPPGDAQKPISGRYGLRHLSSVEYFENAADTK